MDPLRRSHSLEIRSDKEDMIGLHSPQFICKGPHSTPKQYHAPILMLDALMCNGSHAIDPPRRGHSLETRYDKEGMACIPYNLHAKDHIVLQNNTMPPHHCWVPSCAMDLMQWILRGEAIFLRYTMIKRACLACTLHNLHAKDHVVLQNNTMPLHQCWVPLCAMDLMQWILQGEAIILRHAMTKRACSTSTLHNL